MLDKTHILALAEDFLAASPANTVSAEKAISPELVGVKIFDSPLVGVSSADDPLYLEYKRPEVIGSHFLTPKEWLEGAESVVSFFMPFTEAVRRSNRGGDEPSPLWLHGRIEGQAFLGLFASYIAQTLHEAGFRAIVPTLDSRFHGIRDSNRLTGQYFSSNWSERHVAFACGLGTFGLSKGLITEKGMAGRFISLVTDAALTPDPRPYTELYEYCIRCGICAKNCPVQAISLETGKAHPPCAAYQKKMGAKYSPRYGCGKCQTGVPCEFTNPARTRRR